MSRPALFSRREMLACSASALASPLLAAGNRTIGVQLYTVRSTINKDPANVIRTIAQIGYKEIEGASRQDLHTVLPLIKQNGMTAVSCHVETPLVTGDWEHYTQFQKKATLEEAVADVKSMGCTYFVMPYINPNARPTMDFGRTADQMNHAGEMCRKAGLQFAYHNHAFEFAGNPGQRIIDTFRERLDKSLVALEMDIFWVSVAGNDPLQMLKDWSGRVALLHLKDMAQGTPHQFNESLPPQSFKEVGSGVVKIPAILRAAPAAGVKHYFVEQDQTPGDPTESLRKSFNYLRTA
jgi:sugar phosphate isomerase/epimerase